MGKYISMLVPCTLIKRLLTQTDNFFVGTTQQAQIFYAGKMRYIGVYQTRQAACTAFNTIREYLMRDEAQNAADAKDIQRFVEEARKIAQSQIEETN